MEECDWVLERKEDEKEQNFRTSLRFVRHVDNQGEKLCEARYRPTVNTEDREVHARHPLNLRRTSRRRTLLMG